MSEPGSNPGAAVPKGQRKAHGKRTCFLIGARLELGTSGDSFLLIRHFKKVSQDIKSRVRSSHLPFVRLRGGSSLAPGDREGGTFLKGKPLAVGSAENVHVGSEVTNAERCTCVSSFHPHKNPLKAASMSPLHR